MSSVKPHTAISLQEAVDRAPTLSQLSRLAADSAARLELVRPLLPPGMRNAVRAGGLDELGWCLLVPHNAAAAKLRQLVPAMLAKLQAADRPVSGIRIKVVRAL